LPRPPLQGYYHFIRGIDLSSAASISAYVARLVNANMSSTANSMAGTWYLTSITIRAYNAFSKLDVVASAKLPGGMTVHAVTPTGDEQEMTPALWQETYVSGVARALSAAGEAPLYPCLKTFPPMPHSDDEARFVEAALALVNKWPAVQSPGEAARTELGPVGAAGSAMASLLTKYFQKYSRYEQAVQFFYEKLDQDMQELGYIAALALKDIDRLDRARQIIDKLLRKFPNSCRVVMTSALIAMAEDDVDRALTEGFRACDMPTADNTTRTCTALLCVQEKQFSEAIKLLNDCDLEPPPLDHFLRKLISKSRRITSSVPTGSSGSDSTDAIRVLAKRCKEERTNPSSGFDEMLAELPARLMAESERDIYAVLVEILNIVGWDELLSIRGSSFVMESDAQAQSDLQDDDDQDEDEGSTPTKGGSGGNGKEGISQKSAQVEGISRLSVAEDAMDGAAGSSKAPAGKKEAPSNEKDDDADGEDAAATEEDTPASEAETPAAEAEVEAAAKTASKPRPRRFGAKKLCKPWLDFLVTNMYEDLRTMAVWLAEDDQMTQKHSSETENAPPVVLTAQDVLNDTRRSAVDWLRRGDLASRLKRTDRAMLAYEVCIKLSEKSKIPCVAAWVSLCDLYSRHGMVEEAIIATDYVWSFMDANCDTGSSERHARYTLPVPPVEEAIYRLVSQFGLKKVRSVLNSDLSVAKPRLFSLLLDAVESQTFGFSR